MKISMKALRVNSGFSQLDAAKKLGISTETLRNWESGRTSPKAEQLFQLCNLYGCSMSDIFLPQKLA